jgi:hypothetical protein
LVNQKILVFELQKEKSKQSKWMGWDRIALLRKGASPVLQGEEREEATEGMVGASGVCWQTECAFIFQPSLKPTLPHGGQAQEVPTQWWRSREGHGQFPARWGWSDPSPGNLYEPETFPTSSLPQWDLTNFFPRLASNHIL